MTDASPAAALRRLTAADAPLAGELLAGEPLRVRTDAALWQDHPAWRARPDGHLLAPVDADRGPEGRGVLVPHCPQTLREAWDTAGTLTDGEAVTVAVSLLRGAAEADALQIETGMWWITASGRPVLAAGGASAWRADTDAMLVRCAEGRTARLAAAMGAARDALAEPRRLARMLEAVEGELFLAAPPEPLTWEHRGAAPVMTSAGVVPQPRSAVARAIPDDADHTTSAGALATGVHQAIRRHLDAGWADRVRDAWADAVTAAAGRRARRRGEPRDRPSRSRRAPLVAGLTVAGVILGAGLLWPEDSDSSTSAPSITTPAATASPATDARPGEPAHSSPATAPPSLPIDLTAVATTLIESLAECAPDGCTAATLEHEDLMLPDGAATRATTARTVSLLDDYGGVAAFEVAAEGLTSQMVVIVRVDDEWLVRDVYDVADQP